MCGERALVWSRVGTAVKPDEEEVIVYWSDGSVKVLWVAVGIEELRCPYFSHVEVDDLGDQHMMFGCVIYRWDGSRDATGRRVFR